MPNKTYHLAGGGSAIVPIPDPEPKPPAESEPPKFDLTTNEGRVDAGLYRQKTLGPMDGFGEAVFRLAKDVDRLKAEIAELKGNK